MKEKNLSPIALFTYKRLDCLKLTVDALSKNHLAKSSVLNIFSDAPKSQTDATEVEAVRKYLRSVAGFKEIVLIEASANKGLAGSIIDGVSHLLDQYGKVIVVEDDLITSPNFLDFMNQSLDFYSSSKSVFSISGFTQHVQRPEDDRFDSFIHGRAHSWGWATWKDRWLQVDWDVADWQVLKNSRSAQNSFNKYGSDLFKMLKDYKEGRNNSWYVRFTYTQQKLAKYTVYPYVSKVLNVGFDADATHCNVYNRTNFNLDPGQQIVFDLQDNIDVKSKVFNQIVRLKSVRYRIESKILTYLMRWGFIKQRTYKKWH